MFKKIIPENDAEKLWKENRDKLLTGKESPKQFLDRVVRGVYGNANMDEVHAKWEATETVVVSFEAVIKFKPLSLHPVSLPFINLNLWIINLCYLLHVSQVANLSAIV